MGGEEPGTKPGPCGSLSLGMLPRNTPKIATQHLQEPDLHSVASAPTSCSLRGPGRHRLSQAVGLPRCQLAGSWLITHFCKIKGLIYYKAD